MCKMNTEKPEFDIIYGIDNVMNTLELISNARHQLGSRITIRTKIPDINAIHATN